MADTTLSEQLHSELDGLLQIGYPDDAAQRRMLLRSWLVHESRAAGLKSGDAASAEQWQSITARCRYYAAQELLVQHAARQRGLDGDEREDLLIYLQDQLLRDDFKRLRQYSAERGAALRTWLGHVLKNITLDFLRQRQRLNKQLIRGMEVDGSGDVLVGGEAVVQPEATEPSAAEHYSQFELQQLLQDLFADSEASTATADGARDRLRVALSLQASERLFLKMVYVSGLNPEEAGERLSLSKNAAYGLQRRLLDRIASACKTVGLYADLQELADGGEVNVAVEMNGQIRRLPPSRLRHFSKSSARSCQVWLIQNGEPEQHEVNEAFGSVHRRLYASCSLVQSAESIVDEHLLALHGSDAELHDMTQRFAVNSRYIRPLRALLQG